MAKLLDKLRHDYPHIRFVQGVTCYWSPKNTTITFSLPLTNTVMLGILHELGHALLGHTTYRTDAELLGKEVAAWEQVHKLAKKYNVVDDEEHVQECLDTYRDWVNRRSTCPRCNVKTVSNATNTYSCFNCSTSWHVSPARHHRPYRRIQKLPG